MLVAIVGGILLVAAVLVSSISALRLKPGRFWRRWSKGGRNDMNLGLRAILYTVRKWKKTLLVFCLILSISTLVLSGLAIADAQEEQTEEVRGTTGASFTVQRDISTGGWSSGSGGSYSTQEFMTEDMIREIARWTASRDMTLP